MPFPLYPIRRAQALAIAGLAALGAPAGPAGARPAETATPAPCAPALEAAADDYAAGRLGRAQDEFRSVAEDAAEPPFVRGLGLFGQARAIAEQGDMRGGAELLERTARSGVLEGAHRDMALRIAGEWRRTLQGLPARDPAAYRMALPEMGQPGLEIQVSAGARHGNGSWWRPFGTLQEARDAVRALRGRLPRGGVRILVHGGVYPVRGTLELGPADSGEAGSPVVYAAASGAHPVLTGGVSLRGWRPVSDPVVRGDFPAAARQRILEVDLDRLGIADLGDPTEPKRSPQLYYKGIPQSLASWPKQGWMRLGETLGREPADDGQGRVEGTKDGVFRYTDAEPSRWAGEPDVRLHGYFYYDWFDDYSKVASIDPVGRVMTLAKPYARYGYRKGQRFRAVNVRQELRDPGEWYLDRAAHRLYWLPPAGADPERDPVELSCFAGPFIRMAEAHDVILLGVGLRAGRADAIRISGGARCLVAGCSIQGFGGDGVVISGGSAHAVYGCLVERMGCGGVSVTAGDPVKLVAGGVVVENCTLRDLSLSKHTYTPAVLLEGCGNRAAHNRIERMPSSAFRVGGFDQLVELNQVSHVVTESDDQGGADMFGSPLPRGNVYRWNYWGFIAGGTSVGSAGVRLDDMISGTAVYGNVFEGCGSVLFGAIQIHGGQRNLIDGNIIFGGHAGVSFSGWGRARWNKAVAGFLAQAASRNYLDRYPALAALLVDVDVNDLCRNIFVGCGTPFLRDYGNNRSSLELEARAWNGGAVPPSAQRLASDPALRRLLLDPIPYGEIGPYPSPWRAAAD